ncbi:MAG: hypothetical protein G3I10_02190 [Ferrovum sp.]|nr:hypothetical protein [Ferrovum sp.]
MRYEVHGSFEILRNGRFVSRTRDDKREFWETVEEYCEGLADACGCYVFSIRGRVWYVGLAERQSFHYECFSGHKVLQYNEALQSVSGTPFLTFLPKLTPGDRFARPSTNGHRDIRMLENLLIGVALRRNPELQNARGTKLLREMNVPGFLNTQRGQARAGTVQQLKRVLGI